MPRYVIEREIPGAGRLSADELGAIAQKSCAVLDAMGPQIQWQQSYVTGDKVYCVYIAPSEQLLHEHARRGGFPVDRVSEVAAVIDPVTAEGWTEGRRAWAVADQRPSVLQSPMTDH